MRRSVTAMVLLAASCLPAAAGPFKKDRVPDTAGWVAHVDVQAFLGSQVGKLALAEARKQEKFNNSLAAIRQAFGFDPLMDLRGVTLYGQRLGDDLGVVILDALVSQDKLLPMLQANETYKAHQHGDRTLHQWNDAPKPVHDAKTGEITSYVPGKKQFGCFYDADTVLIASSLELLREGVDVLDGKAPSLAGSKALAALPEQARGAFLVAAAERIELARKDADKPEAAIFRQLTAAALQVGESEGSLFVDLTAMVKTAERAAKLREIVEGLVALGQIMMEERPDIPALGERVSVTADGGTVRVRAVAPSESAAKLIRFLMAQAPKARAGG